MSVRLFTLFSRAAYTKGSGNRTQVLLHLDAQDWRQRVRLTGGRRAVMGIEVEVVWRTPTDHWGSRAILFQLLMPSGGFRLGSISMLDPDGNKGIDAGKH